MQGFGAAPFAVLTTCLTKVQTMPVNPSFVGRSYPPTPPYRVSREKIREFADAINDPNPAYRSVEAAQALGHPDVVAPPTFPIVLTLPAGHQFIADPEAGVDYSRVVHGEQRSCTSVRSSPATSCR